MVTFINKQFPFLYSLILTYTQGHHLISGCSTPSIIQTPTPPLLHSKWTGRFIPPDKTHTHTQGIFPFSRKRRRQWQREFLFHTEQTFPAKVNKRFVRGKAELVLNVSKDFVETSKLTKTFEDVFKRNVWKKLSNKEKIFIFWQPCLKI